jgi:hypothetical protein
MLLALLEGLLDLILLAWGGPRPDKDPDPPPPQPASASVPTVPPPAREAPERRASGTCRARPQLVSAWYTRLRDICR